MAAFRQGGPSRSGRLRLVAEHSLQGGSSRSRPGDRSNPSKRRLATRHTADRPVPGADRHRGVTTVVRRHEQRSNAASRRSLARRTRPLRSLRSRVLRRTRAIRHGAAVGSKSHCHQGGHGTGDDVLSPRVRSTSGSIREVIGDVDEKTQSANLGPDRTGAAGHLGPPDPHQHPQRHLRPLRRARRGFRQGDHPSERSAMRRRVPSSTGRRRLGAVDRGSHGAPASRCRRGRCRNATRSFGCQAQAPESCASFSATTCYP